MKIEKNIFPFSAIKGQDEMKLGLLLNVIDPEIKGLLVFGDRGTGKSTTIRALVDLLPEIEVVKDDPYNQPPQQILSNEFSSNSISYKSEMIKTPMVDLPLGATEDRVCGSINLEKAIQDGTKAFEPGLLAKANRGILYVDEVNLLDDHLIDILLDAAASGRNIVEREGISIKHPARFILVGSGNPEEGEVRPQLLDRFGLYSEIKTVKNPDTRLEIVDARMEFDINPEKWMAYHKEEQEKLKNQIIKAKEVLAKISLDKDLKLKICRLCSILDIDGLRGDLVIHRAAKAVASLEGLEKVDANHIAKIILLCLRHRLRKDPLELIDSGRKVERTFSEIFSE